MLPIGTLLRGDTYRVIRQLNSGGFGNTYVVENIHFGEIRAMKEFFMQGVTTRRGNTVSVSQSDNADVFRSQKEKFKKEAQRIRKLNHPNIVKIYDLFEENDTYYYIMDYIDGESLADRLKRQGAMQEREAMQVLNSLLDALSAVHAAGLTHMDIKPGNIMRDRQGQIFLIDFGASKQMTSNEQRTLSTSTAMPYSKGYAPMEQVEQDMSKVGPWTDFYAVGATLYKLLTNIQPPSSNEIITTANPFCFPISVSHSTQSLVKWMMQPARDKRPKSVSDIRRYKNSEDDGETIYDYNKPESRQMLTSSFREKFKQRGLIGIIVVVAVLVVFGLIYWKMYFSPTIETKTINVNGVSFKMIKVEGGTFTMGATPEQGDDAEEREYPAHKVKISTYYIGETEVTQELWMSVMGNNPSEFKGREKPVEHVNWADCQLFISKLNSLSGYKFRLPTEAEWEYAARGGKYSRGYKYSGSDDAGDVAWYDSGNETHKVKMKQPNELKLYDMSGNVGEWCSDWYGDYSPNMQSNPIGLSDGSTRVVRGGCQYCYAYTCRVSCRRASFPDDRTSTDGLRLVLEAY